MKAALILMAFLLAMVSCDNRSRQYEDNLAVRINNRSFDADKETQTPSGWKTESESNDADADFTKPGGMQGSFCLTHSRNSAYKVFTYQEVKDLDTGYYTLTAMVKNSGGQNACYLTASGESKKMTSLPVSSSWTKVIVRGLHVLDGKCRIGLYSDAAGGNWCTLDDVSLKKEGGPYNFLKGGDLSELSYIESMGGRFIENGIVKDCMQILQENEFNIARLRLYNDPGNPSFSPSNRLPAGFQDKKDILRLAKRAKNAGMQIELTFYYSDYWSTNKPHMWQNLSFQGLKDSVYAFTFNFMQSMKAQGTLPEYVSIGNEITGGFLKPDGASSDFPQLAEFLKQGYNAVKAVSQSTEVIIHLDDAGNRDKYDWFFGECNKNGVKYDIIGASYYPFWTQKTVAQIIDWADYISSKFDRDIMIMETGYPFNPTLPDGKKGQLANNGPYEGLYPNTPEGQKNFMYECFNGLKLASKGRIIGDLYWDPVMIEVEGVGWELGADNVVSNTTLFDFGGNALPVLKAFKYNN